VIRKQINTNLPSVSCDVCGRSLLRGEHAAAFIFQGTRRNVCDLCTVRAAHDGWIREGVDDVELTLEERPRLGGLRGLMRARRSEQQLQPGGAEALLGGNDSAQEPAPLAEPAPEPAREVPPELTEHDHSHGPVHQAAPGESLYEERSVRGIPSNAELKVVRAIELFNGSPHVRTVGGVMRSLGTPTVSARPSLTEGSVVTIVVAWELSWYRFEVDLGDEAAGVRVVGQGAELSDLHPAEREPNGSATAAGKLEYVLQPPGVDQ
jgi:hypothetical protein